MKTVWTMGLAILALLLGACNDDKSSGNSQKPKATDSDSGLLEEDRQEKEDTEISAETPEGTYLGCKGIDGGKVTVCELKEDGKALALAPGESINWQVGLPPDPTDSIDFEPEVIKGDEKKDGDGNKNSLKFTCGGFFNKLFTRMRVYFEFRRRLRNGEYDDGKLPEKEGTNNKLALTVGDDGNTYVTHKGVNALANTAGYLESLGQLRVEHQVSKEEKEDILIWVKEGDVSFDKKAGYTQKTLPTINDYEGVEGCFVSCLSDVKTGSSFTNKNGDFVHGQISLEGYILNGSCSPKDVKGDLESSEDLTNLCEKHIDSCANGACFASGEAYTR